MTRLRAAEPADAAILERQNSGPDAAGAHNWHGYRAPGQYARRIASGESIREDGGMLVVVDDDGQLVGDVSWIRMSNGPPPNGYCWNMGIWILPEHRGKGHGAAAQRLLVDYLFANTYLERVEASTEADNVGEQKALEKAGFTREGVLRRTCFRDGQWRDMVLYSKLRGEK
ncbi:MAG TPA: GNAT family protein [Mycobacteriales bacterium]|nr:GNAT family protein [Mycobacteriales bacterium]